MAQIIIKTAFITLKIVGQHRMGIICYCMLMILKRSSYERVCLTFIIIMIIINTPHAEHKLSIPSVIFAAVCLY